MTKKALITGITGQDGSYLAELLLDKGYEVHGIIRRLSTPNEKNIENIKDKLILSSADLSDQNSINSVMKEIMPDEVYNLASQSFVPASFSQPILTGDVTGLGVTRMLEGIRLINEGAKFYQASTSELFGIAHETPQRETTQFHPRSPYGVAKLYGHYITVNYRESYDLFAASGILFNHESERRGLEFVTRKITSTVAEIKHGIKEVLEMGNLDAKRDWGYAKDYVEAMWMMLQQEKPEDYVISTGETHTVREFVTESFKTAGMDVEWTGEGMNEVGAVDGVTRVKVNPRFYRPAEVNLLLGDSTKAKTNMGWEPKHKFDDLVKIMMDHDLKEVESNLRYQAARY
jgi:GDPmannose 4,6-dehydratase